MLIHCPEVKPSKVQYSRKSAEYWVLNYCIYNLKNSSKFERNLWIVIRYFRFCFVLSTLVHNEIQLTSFFRRFANAERFLFCTFRTPASAKLWLHLRSFHRFAVRSSSAHEGKIIIFERFQCSLTKTIEVNWQLEKLIGQIKICSI